MDLLDRLLAHDVWTTRQLLRHAAHLSDADLDRRFDVDNRTLRECFLHIIGAMEIWTDRLHERPERTYDAAEKPSIDALLARLGAAGREFAAFARTVARENRWNDVFRDPVRDTAPPLTFGGTIAHLITHSMHHRAQVMYMLEQLGVRDHAEGDVLTWEETAFGWEDPPATQ